MPIVTTATEAESILRQGKCLYVPTYTQCMRLTLRDWESWEAAGKPLLRDAKDGGIWLAGRKRSTYIMRGQLVTDA
jgi:hypothetical protein